jgi:hypothetical protein
MADVAESQTHAHAGASEPPHNVSDGHNAITCDEDSFLELNDDDVVPSTQEQVLAAPIVRPNNTGSRADQATGGRRGTSRTSSAGRGRGRGRKGRGAGRGAAAAATEAPDAATTTEAADDVVAEEDTTWTEDEDKKLIEVFGLESVKGCTKGAAFWSAVAHRLTGEAYGMRRTADACRQRWSKRLRKSFNEARWILDRSGEGAMPVALEKCPLYNFMLPVVGARAGTANEAPGDSEIELGGTPTHEQKAQKRGAGAECVPLLQQ